MTWRGMFYWRRKHQCLIPLSNPQSLILCLMRHLERNNMLQSTRPGWSDGRRSRVMEAKVMGQRGGVVLMWWGERRVMECCCMAEMMKEGKTPCGATAVLNFTGISFHWMRYPAPSKQHHSKFFYSFFFLLKVFIPFYLMFYFYCLSMP